MRTAVAAGGLVHLRKDRAFRWNFLTQTESKFAESSICHPYSDEYECQMDLKCVLKNTFHLQISTLFV